MNSTAEPHTTEPDDDVGAFVRSTPPSWRRWIILVVVGALAAVAVPASASPSIDPHVDGWGANADGSGFIDLVVWNKGWLPIEVRSLVIDSRGVAVDRSSSIPLRVAASESRKLHVRLRFTDCAEIDHYLRQFDLAVAVMPLGIVRHIIVTADIPGDPDGAPVDGFLVMTSAVVCPPSP